MTDKERYELLEKIIRKKFDEKVAGHILLRENYFRAEEELQFFKDRPSLVLDTLKLLKDKQLNNEFNGPNSIIMFILDITNQKPDFNRNFYFRFEVDKENSRISPPDIDMDFEHREPILTHICELYGVNNVALIGTEIGFKPKAAVQFAAKVLDITKTAKNGDKRFSSENDQEAKRLSKIMPNMPTITLEQWLGEDPDFKAPNRYISEAMQELKKEIDKYPEVFDIAKRLEKIFKSYGTHPAGVVISSMPIVEDIPLHVAKVIKEDDDGFDDFEDIDEENTVDSANLMTTQFDMEDVEETGLLKFDFLQINTLREFRLCQELIKQRIGKELPFDIEKLETDDPKVFKTIDSGKLEGLFQISGKAFAGETYPRFNKETGKPILDDNNVQQTYKTKGLMSVIGCNSFRDIVAANALGRPGPLACGMHKKYAEGKKDPSSIEYSHPLLEPILKKTYGQIIFQEDLTKMAQVLAGFSFSQADNLRKACAKKKKELLDKMKSLFFDGCEKNKISKKIAEDNWNILLEFSEYGFNEAHSVGYSVISYISAFLKTYYPTEFICSILTSKAKKDDKKLEKSKKKFLEEYKKLELLSPDINKSKKTYVPGDKLLQVVAPFISLKGVGSRASDHLVENQPYTTIEHFLTKIDRSIVDTRVINTLIDNDVMKSFGEKETIVREVKRYEEYIRVNKGAKQQPTNTKSLF